MRGPLILPYRSKGTSGLVFPSRRSALGGSGSLSKKRNLEIWSKARLISYLDINGWFVFGFRLISLLNCSYEYQGTDRGGSETSHVGW